MSTTQTAAWPIIKRVLNDYIRPHRWRIALALVCMIIVAVTTAANAWIMQPVLDEIFVAKDRSMLMIIPIAVACIAILSGIGNYGQTVLMRYVGQHVIATMQSQLFSHLMKADLASFHDQSAGRMISRFTNDIMMMRLALTQVLTGAAKESLSFVFLIGVMIYQSWQLSVIALLLFPIAIWPVVRLGKRMRKLADQTQHQLGEFTNELDEVFQGARIVKAYGAEPIEIQKAQNRIWHLFMLYYKTARVQAAASPLMEILGGIGIAAVIGYGGHQVLAGETTPGGFFSFITAMIMAYRPIKAVATLNTHLQEGVAAASRFFTAIDTMPHVIESPDAKEIVVKEGHVVFDNVTFHYGENEGGVETIAFEVQPGKTLALVGASGGGKSTLINLLMRFYDPQKGSITIDGQIIKDASFASLRKHLALVSQDIVLFDASVAENIAYGMPNAKEDDIIAAAKAAYAHDFIEEMHEGYDTKIGPHGVKLSGGQRQRLSIARAILKNAPILLLDEATSALDSESERMVQEALAAMMQQRTTLVVAHRLSTIRDADEIVVLDKGRIVERGTHDALLATDGHYATLHTQQFATA